MGERLQLYMLLGEGVYANHRLDADWQPKSFVSSDLPNLRMQAKCILSKIFLLKSSYPPESPCLQDYLLTIGKYGRGMETCGGSVLACSICSSCPPLFACSKVSILSQPDNVNQQTRCLIARKEAAAFQNHPLKRQPLDLALSYFVI